MVVLPALDLLAGRVVRLGEHGDFDRPTSYADETDQVVRLARRYVVAGARRLHVVDLDAARGSGHNGPMVQRLVDAQMAIPGLLLLLNIMAVMGPGLLNIILALGIVSAAGSSRIIRSAALSVKENQFVEAARAIGASHLRIILRYILPNIMAPIIIITTVSLGFTILIESALSFLGFGVPPPYPSWGEMLSGSGRSYMYKAPWMATWPGVAISLAVFGFNMLGDALRDLLDPRLRGGRLVQR